MKNFLSYLLLIFLSLTGTDALAQIEIVNAFPNLSFSAPVDFQFANELDNKVYVAERAGRIRVFENDPETSETNEFLDIRDQVNTSGEGGLLGFAFHPEYETNGYFYVYYTAGSPFRSVISRFEVSDNELAANENSELILLEIDQPYNNHNGGQIRFGPDDYLYIALGDGGSGGDPDENGEDRTTLLGSILRLDVDNTEGELNYAIPPDNPFVDNNESYREEIYAYGLRNPYRFSFDAETDELWVADVGQSSREEINIVEKGLNYGWNTMEGSLCYDPSSGCDTSGRELPIYEYGRGEGGSITGGFVYRGSAVSEMQGRYVYADFVSGNIWMLSWDGEQASDNQLIDNFNSYQLVGFGEDQDRELYLTSFDGNIYTFRSEVSNSNEDENDIASSVQLRQNYPNPFNPSTKISYSLNESAFVSLRVFNMLGQEIEILERSQKSAGTYTVSFDGSDLSSGLYIYKLEAGAFSLTRRMILMK
jgi:glucose/arabinose dehydrogenase